MRLLLTCLGLVLYHLVFGVALLGGLVGVAAIANQWSKLEPGEGGMFLAVSLLCASVAAAGLIGILKFRDKQTRTLDVEADLAPLRPLKPMANLISGLLIVATCAAGIYFQTSLAKPGDLIRIPVVAAAAGGLQAAFGAWQFLRTLRHS